ncbi:hypothetical protein F5Y10DRAFT_269420 [Nemania abortiva]|nr:hypothetical protein F5Y10DRAFT_269420 [Nemania abortiva]
MAYSNDLSLPMPPHMKGTVGGASITKQPLKRPQRHQPKSQPFDPEDLRRRLYVVIAEREAQNEKRQRQRVDALPAKWAQVEKERDTQVYIERLTKTSTSTTWPGPDMTAPVRCPRSAPISKPPSRQDKARRRTSMMASSERADTNTAETNTTSTGYRHIPEVAAAQFSRTTTSTGMQSDKSLVHSLSKAALRFYAEGPSSADRQAIDSSITPGRQRSLLQRSRSQREQQHGRNQFQAPRLAGDDHHHQTAGPWRRGSNAGAGDAMILEEDGVSALADLHLHAFPSQGSEKGVMGAAGAGGPDVYSSEETLVDAAAAAREHRIDWSQSDEMLPSERKGLRIQIPPILRRTGSILTLKGKLGGQHSRKGSGDNNNHNNNNNNRENNGLSIVTIHEDCDEQAEAEADDGSTPMSPNSGSPRYGRGFWGRLRRN